MDNKPVIRTLHHMARSGGTIISRCLGSMEGVILLSEINPAGMKYYNPLGQAHNWYQLFSPADIAAVLAGTRPNFMESVDLIYERCVRRSATLVIRDWSHLDFTGWPHVASPSYRLMLAETLDAKFDVIHTMTVRHPIDQWLSFGRLHTGTNASMPLDAYLYGYRKFAEICSKHHYVRYEDFTINPQQAMQQVCGNLSVAYDADFISKWASYSHITTDPGERDGGTVIQLRPRRSLQQSVLDQFQSNNDYQLAISLLGYENPEP